jgi:hypothetical protein
MHLLNFVRGALSMIFYLRLSTRTPAHDPDAVNPSTRFYEHLVIKRRIVFKHRYHHSVGDGGRLGRGGGTGVICRGFRPVDIQPQVAKITEVKRTQHGTISDPHTILGRLGEALSDGRHTSRLAGYYGQGCLRSS